MAGWIMVDPKAEVIKFLMSNSAVFAAFANRITVDKIPDKQTFPNARIWSVGGKNLYHHAGASGGKVLLQIDVYAETAESADTNTSLVTTAMSGYKGMMGDMYVGMCKVTRPSGGYNPDLRMNHRMFEAEIGINE